MSQHADASRTLSEPTFWFLLGAALAMTLWCALFFDQFVISLRQVLGYALAGSEGWAGARLAEEVSVLRPWFSCAAFALMGCGVAIGVTRRRPWAARALRMLWFATMPVIGMVLYAGLSASGKCVAKPALLDELRCLGVIGGLALPPVGLWAYAHGQIRRAHACWREAS